MVAIPRPCPQQGCPGHTTAPSTAAETRPPMRPTHAPAASPTQRPVPWRTLSPSRSTVRPLLCIRAHTCSSSTATTPWVYCGLLCGSGPAPVFAPPPTVAIRQLLRRLLGAMGVLETSHGLVCGGSPMDSTAEAIPWPRPQQQCPNRSTVPSTNAFMRPPWQPTVSLAASPPKTDAIGGAETTSFNSPTTIADPQPPLQPLHHGNPAKR